MRAGVQSPLALASQRLPTSTCPLLGLDGLHDLSGLGDADVHDDAAVRDETDVRDDVDVLDDADVLDDVDVHVGLVITSLPERLLSRLLGRLLS